jgi:putative transposase
MMEERGVVVDHSSINRWTIRFLPVLEKAFRKHKHAVGTSWKMDETYIRVNGAWKYLYRAVDKQGQTVDFLLTAKRIPQRPSVSSRGPCGTTQCLTR